ncbi:MAG: AAC(3) family N-acetyltransferase [Candidatus Lokiarchaeota archaeon]|nr:AAC(3) family N-acetyltransferase [Candidatus Lokiarchaeota archaeon]
MIVTKEDIREVLKELDLDKKLACIHSSLKSFGYVKGGPKSIVDAFLERNYTIIVPTFSYDFEIPMFDKKNIPQQNGLSSYENHNPIEIINRYYSPSSNEIHYSMGLIPKYILSIPNRKRGNHPLNSFSAVGKKAKHYIKNQKPKNVYAPLIELYKNDGYLFLMGVDLTKATIIHYTENLTGRNLFIRWANDSEFKPISVNIGGCSDGFNNFNPYIKGIERKIMIGDSIWRIFHLKSFVKIIVDVIKSNPEITHCDNQDCIRCNDAIKGGPII